MTLGLDLGVKKHHITIIQAEYPHDPITQAIQIYFKWQQTDPENPIERLEQALKDINHARTARKLRSITVETITGIYTLLYVQLCVIVYA